MYGNATNWHLSGYWEEKYPPTCKFTVTFWQTVPWWHQDNITIIDRNYFCINARFLGDK
jgi:hypothetical protein